jgi:hypothetical protein
VLAPLGLSPEIINFLANTGMPERKSGGLWVSYESRFPPIGPGGSLRVLGHDPSGALSIDLAASGRVLWVPTGEEEPESFINTTAKHLAHCITFYQQYRDHAGVEDDDPRFDEGVRKLRTQIESCDPRALDKGEYWDAILEQVEAGFL